VCYGNAVVFVADKMYPTPALKFCEVYLCWFNNFSIDNAHPNIFITPFDV
jgi:hypothetical protein